MEPNLDDRVTTSFGNFKLQSTDLAPPLLVERTLTVIVEPFPFLSLPAEIRIVIYNYTFAAIKFPTIEYSASSCPSVNTASPTASKQVYEEASVLFYRGNVFRFSTSQIRTLQMIPRILKHLQRIEIEDAYEGERRWDLCMGLEGLSALPEMRAIVLGTEALGNGINALRKYLLRSKYRAVADYGSIYAPEGTPDGYEVEWSRIVLRNSQAFQTWKGSRPLISDQDLRGFQANTNVCHAALDLERLPKVKVVCVWKRASFRDHLNEDWLRHFPFMKLPVELRLLIYQFYFAEYPPKTYVCCWRTRDGPPRPSFITNICDREPKIGFPPWVICPSLFIASRQVRAEAKNIFYHMNVFRFSSEQMWALFTKPELLENLRRIEIENDTVERRDWALDEVLGALQQLPLLVEVVVGLMVSSENDDTIFRLESTGFIAWEKKYREVEEGIRRSEDYLSRTHFSETLQKLIQDRPFMSPNEKRLIELERKLWYSVARDPSGLERDDFFYQMARFPKVSFVHFNKRALWEADQTVDSLMIGDNYGGQNGVSAAEVHYKQIKNLGLNKEFEGFTRVYLGQGRYISSTCRVHITNTLTVTADYRMEDKIHVDDICQVDDDSAEDDASEPQKQSQFLKLPFEVRMMIYDFALPIDRSTVIVCLWPITGPTSFISNILTPTQHDDFAPHVIDTSLFAVNRQVNAEVSNPFYQKHIFRFSSPQLGTLLMVPAVLNKLRRMEIEDVLPDQRRWNLESMLDKFQDLPLLDEVIVGVVASGECAQTLNRIEDRPFDRWDSENQRLLHKWLDAEDFNERYRAHEEYCRQDEPSPKAMVDKRDGFFFDMWNIRREFPFTIPTNQPIPLDKFSYRMIELPKVTYLNFELRDKCRKSQSMATTSSDSSLPFA
ncbi:hypothetical protein MMC30_009300 [Trapelia coarctata]|nr:hypothetical protein [Trapelia coarctata]